MNWQRHFILGLAVAGWLSSQPPMVVAGDEDPYAPIVTRNVFGLVPIPTNAPVDPASLVPPPKITPNGIMTLFGKLQVLFKVAGVARPGQPPKDESYVMSEGDRQDDIEVQKIDEPSATITFNNHGVVQQLPLVAGTATGGSPAPAPSGFSPPPIPMPRAAPGGDGGIGFGGRFGRSRNVQGGGNPSAGGAPGFGGGAAAMGGTPQQEQVTPEQQIINMESQRAKWLDEGNKAAAIIPRTSLTSRVTGEGGDGDAPMSPPMPGR
jgi:hypothetical protein